MTIGRLCIFPCQKIAVIKECQLIDVDDRAHATIRMVTSVSSINIVLEIIHAISKKESRIYFCKSFIDGPKIVGEFLNHEMQTFNTGFLHNDEK